MQGARLPTEEVEVPTQRRARLPFPEGVPGIGRRHEKVLRRLVVEHTRTAFDVREQFRVGCLALCQRFCDPRLRLGQGRIVLETELDQLPELRVLEGVPPALRDGLRGDAVESQPRVLELLRMGRLLWRQYAPCQQGRPDESCD